MAKLARPLSGVATNVLATVRLALETLDVKSLSLGSFAYKKAARERVEAYRKAHVLGDFESVPESVLLKPEDGCGCVMVAYTALRDREVTGATGPLTPEEIFNASHHYVGVDELIDLNDRFNEDMGDNSQRYSYVLGHVVREQAIREVSEALGQSAFVPENIAYDPNNFVNVEDEDPDENADSGC